MEETSENANKMMLSAANAEDRHRERLSEILRNSKDNTNSMMELRSFMFEFPEEEENYLSTRQLQIVNKWLSDGVRFDTAHWMRTLAAHMQDRTLMTQRALIAALFIDTYNRADDIFDSFRDKFKNEDNLNEKGLKRVPIMELQDGSMATVDDFMQITNLLIRESGAYDSRLIDELKKEIPKFISNSLTAMRTLEQADDEYQINYSEQQAIELREKTLTPLVEIASKLYGIWGPKGTIQHESGRGITDELIAVALSAQVLDDRNDLIEDYFLKNTSIACGVLADSLKSLGLSSTPRVMKAVAERISRGKQWEEYDIADDLVKKDKSNEELDSLERVVAYANSRLKQIYSKYWKDLNPQVQLFFPSPSLNAMQL